MTLHTSAITGLDLAMYAHVSVGTMSGCCGSLVLTVWAHANDSQRSQIRFSGKTGEKRTL